MNGDVVPLSNPDLKVDADAHVVGNIVLSNVHKTIKKTLAGQRHRCGATAIKVCRLLCHAAVFVSIDDTQQLVADINKVLGVVEDDLQVCLPDATEVIRQI